jgi:hypothetical protein
LPTSTERIRLWHRKPSVPAWKRSPRSVGHSLRRRLTRLFSSCLTVARTNRKRWSETARTSGSRHATNSPRTCHQLAARSSSAASATRPHRGQARHHTSNVMSLFHSVILIDHHSAQVLQFDSEQVQAQKVKADTHHTRQHGIGMSLDDGDMPGHPGCPSSRGRDSTGQ